MNKLDKYRHRILRLHKECDLINHSYFNLVTRRSPSGLIMDDLSWHIWGRQRLIGSRICCVFDWIRMGYYQHVRISRKNNGSMYKN